jgi:pimeloyl-ACP methyl ester carboxylesterase
VQPLFEHRLELAGYETRALELEGDGPGLVLLHGWGDSADTWRPLLPQLDACAEALVREWADGEEVVVVGNSLGGVTALRLAERTELSLAGVVPIASAVLRTTVGEVYRQLVFARPRAAEAAVVAAFAAHHASRERVAALLDSGRRLLPELQTSPFDFARVRCPVLLVWGTRDRMVPHTGAQILLEALPHTHVELLDGVGHCPQLEAIERLLELLLPFPATVRA